MNFDKRKIEETETTEAQESPRGSSVRLCVDDIGERKHLENNLKMKRQIIDCGFAEEDAMAGLKRASTVEGAIHWILSRDGAGTLAKPLTAASVAAAPSSHANATTTVATQHPTLREKHVIDLTKDQTEVVASASPSPQYNAATMTTTPHSNRLVQQVIDLGFSAEQALASAKRHSSLERCVEYIVEGGTGGKSTSVDFERDSKSGADPIDCRNDDSLARALQSVFDDEDQCNLQIITDLSFARALQDTEDVIQKADISNVEDTMDVLKDYRDNIEKLLREKANTLKIASIQGNPHSQVGTSLYNRFINAWQQVHDQSIVLAFHGTAEQNVDSICRNGLDPKRRNGQALGPGEYFAEHANVSVGYCKGGKKMIVVALLMDQSGLTANRGGVIVVNKPEHQLPMFVLTFQ